MNLHEYQGKEILHMYGVPVQYGYVAETVDQAIEAAEKMKARFNSKIFVLKAQVHAGGRGKGGGIKIAKSMDEVREKSAQILGMTLVTKQTGAQGKFVRKILVTDDVYYPGENELKEFYIGVLLNRATGRNIIMYSPAGGVEIEEVAEKTPELIFKEEIDPKVGLQDFQTRKIAFNLGCTGQSFKAMQKFVQGLYKAYIGVDASLFEINPCLKTSDNKLFAVDAKVVLEDNALYRHPDLEAMRDKFEEDPIDVEANEHGLNYVKLDGNVGCMVNGAGLAMATMDIIKLSGGEPANFLDVGGTANAARVEQAFRIILKEPSVKAILINIFGGIVRCDRVAQGIVDAYNSIGNIHIPVIVRLQGTNAVEAKALIDNSGLKVLSAISLQEAADLVKQVVK
jgi:succinyl-CoA synthetase beta subunit